MTVSGRKNYFYNLLTKDTGNKIINMHLICNPEGRKLAMILIKLQSVKKSPLVAKNDFGRLQFI
jgi:hypothetical protein